MCGCVHVMVVVVIDLAIKHFHYMIVGTTDIRACGQKPIKTQSKCRLLTNTMWFMFTSMFKFKQNRLVFKFDFFFGSRINIFTPNQK